MKSNGIIAEGKKAGRLAKNINLDASKYNKSAQQVEGMFK